ELHRAAFDEAHQDARAATALQTIAGLQLHARGERRAAAFALEPCRHLHAFDHRRGSGAQVHRYEKTGDERGAGRECAHVDSYNPRLPDAEPRCKTLTNPQRWSARPRPSGNRSARSVRLKIPPSGSSTASPCSPTPRGSCTWGM